MSFLHAKHYPPSRYWNPALWISQAQIFHLSHFIPFVFHRHDFSTLPDTNRGASRGLCSTIGCGRGVRDVDYLRVGTRELGHGADELSDVLGCTSKLEDNNLDIKNETK